MSRSPKGSSQAKEPAEKATLGKDERSYIPRFDNTMTGYREWRKRILLFARRQAIQGRANETGLSVLSILEGASWRQCEDLDLDALEKDDGLKSILQRLDAQWQYDDRVEMPDAFEKYFYKTQRRVGQSLLEFCTEHQQSLRELQKYKISLPEQVAGWLLLRKAGLSKDQQQMIYTQAGTDMSLNNIEKSMYMILGQDYKHVHQPAVRRAQNQSFQGRWKSRQLIHMAEDDELWEQDDWTEDYEPDEDAFYEADEWYDQEYDLVDDPEDLAYLHHTDEDTIFDTEEYDMAMAAYTDAKQRVLELKRSRGFYPVVAMVDKNQLPVMANANSSSGGKSPKGRGKKGKSKSKAPQGKGPQGKARARDAMVCHRCGKPGHFASQCKASSSSTTPTSAKKRTLEETDPLLTGMVLFENVMARENDTSPKNVMACENVTASENVMVCENATSHENVMTLVNDTVQVEFYDCEEFFECEDAYSSSDVLVSEHEWLVPPEMAIQDQGASSFLIGTEYILRYMAWLQLLGVDLSRLEFKKCSKHFKFGGDASGHARWLLSVPTYINGKAGFIQAYIIFGATPPLLGRPVMERLQAVVDFGAYKMQILGSDWLPIEKGRQNTMLMRLARKEAGPMQFNNHQFDLRTEDDHHEILRFDDFIEDMKAQSRFSCIKSNLEKTFKPSTVFTAEDLESPPQEGEKEKNQESLRGFWNMVLEQICKEERRLQREVLHARDHQPDRQPVVWEVYVGRGNVTKECQRLGAKVRRFGLEDGWNFNKAADRRAFLQLADEEAPDEMWLSPKCTLWSTMQNINVKTEDDRLHLKARRQEDHEKHLKFCRRAYLGQVRRGSHAHIEHPAHALSWKTPAFANLPGYKVIFDQCEYGATTMNDNHEEMPIKKPTALQTTKLAMVRRMSKRCSGDHMHQTLEGSNRCHKAEDYPVKMAQHIAHALVQPEGLEEQTFAAGDGDEQELTGVLRKLATTHGSEAARLAFRLHRNLGHPRKELLVSLLRQRGCGEKIIKAAEDLECPYCKNFAVRKGAAPAHLSRAENFNTHVQADVMWYDLVNEDPDGATKRKGKKIPILVMVDEATRFMSARTVPDEQGPSLQKAFERGWIRHHGPPERLFVDEATGWASDNSMKWAEEHGIEMRISPGQDHTRTSIVERRHQLLRRGLAVFIREHQLTGLVGLQDALNWIVPSLNNNTFVNGYTPCQLAHGRQPNVPGLLSDERTSPLQLQTTEQERLYKKLQLRASAHAACAKAEIDVKLRRALLRRFTGQNEDLSPGERCLYWRESNDRFHTIQWRGPAVVLAVQRDPDTNVVDTYWIAHGTSLLRAGKQHVRKLPNLQGSIGSTERAIQAMEGLRQRRVVRIIDLERTNRQSLDDMDPDHAEAEELLAPEVNIDLEPLQNEHHQAPLNQGDASEPPGPNEPHGQSESPGHNEPPEHLVGEPDVPMDPGQLPPVPEDQDLDEPQQHVSPSVAEPDPDPEWELDPLYAQPAGSQETFEELDLTNKKPYKLDEFIQWFPSLSQQKSIETKGSEDHRKKICKLTPTSWPLMTP